MTTPPFDAVSDEDVRIVSLQLGRPARDVIGIAARCVCGAPTVVSTKPRLSDGTPFPTIYYLCHPAATASVSTLEAEGQMPELAAMLEGEIGAQYHAAHEAYIADRDGIEVVPELAGVSAGGMPTRVKCLHALVGHSLAAGPGVNPIGDIALERASWSPSVCQCPDYSAALDDDAAKDNAAERAATEQAATEQAATEHSDAAQNAAAVKVAESGR